LTAGISIVPACLLFHIAGTMPNGVCYSDLLIANKFINFRVVISGGQRKPAELVGCGQ